MRYAQCEGSPGNTGSPEGSPRRRTTHGNWIDQDRSDAAPGREAGTDQQASAAFLDLLAETAIKETKKNGVFVIPGIGRLVKAERKARIGRNPQTGAAIKIKAKTVVKFRVAKAAKDVIAPVKK
jgi:DNA-binding protein HU-beta